jgi:replication factor A1
VNDVLYIENGYVSLVQGHIHLNVGKYGKMTKSDKDIPEINSEVNVSAAEHEQERRRFGPRPGGYRSGGYESRGYGSGERRGGYRRRY